MPIKNSIPLGCRLTPFHGLIRLESGAIDGHAPTGLVAELQVIGGALPILRDDETTTTTTTIKTTNLDEKALGRSD